MDASIIIPVYNAEKYLKECLESVINQKTKYKYEIIVINDGSTDNSLNILKTYSNKIKIIDKPNSGPGDSRNKGLELASGKYILFVDSDDYVNENFVETMVKTIDKNNADIVICDYYRVTKNEVKYFNKGPEGIYLKNNFNEVLLMEFHSCNKIFTKKIFNNEKYPIGMLFEDVVLISKLILKANKIVKINNPLYYYRENDNSTTNIINDSNFDILKATEMIEQDFINNNYKKEIEFLFINNILVDLIVKVFKSNKDDKVKQIKLLKKIVTTKYPYWYRNKYLKRQKFSKRLYLLFLRYNMYGIINLVFKSR